MKKTEQSKLHSVADFHKLWGLPKPEHPLISVIDFSKANPQIIPEKIIVGCYLISIKRNIDFNLIYGHQALDFDEGVMFFLAPNQVLRIEKNQVLQKKPEGWALLIHPDFLWKTSLAKRINQFDFFNYSANEALFLSEKEENIITSITQNIEQEYHSNIDNFSQGIVIAHLETLLSYAERFYHRQFITRKKINHQILNRLEELLTTYFNDDNLISKGLPTAQYISEELNMSVNYLSRLLKTLTGQSTQQHIHDKLIEKAKEKLSTTNLSISEIAYGLGFEHSQAFSRLFKSKTNQSPLEFRQSFN
jgi:AraC-like DNA-binding protein